jgi:hypothetical protein
VPTTEPTEQPVQSDPDPGDGEKKNILSLEVGKQFKAPATGEIKTIYLDISTQFQDSVTVAVDVFRIYQKSFGILADM